MTSATEQKTVGKNLGDAVVVDGPKGCIINTTILESGFHIRRTDNGRTIDCDHIEQMMRSIYTKAFEKLVECGVLDSHGRPRMSLEEGYPVITRASHSQEIRRDHRKHICEMIMSWIDLPQESFLFPVEILMVPIENIVSVIEDPGRRICCRPVHYGFEVTLNMAGFIVSRDSIKIQVVYLPNSGHYGLEIGLADIMNRPETIVIESNTGNMDRFLRDLPPDELSSIVITIRRTAEYRKRQKRMLTIFRPNPISLSIDRPQEAEDDHSDSEEIV